MSEFSLPNGTFNANAHGRRYMIVQRAPFWQEAFSAFDMNDIRPEPRYYTFIGNHFLDGAHTHPHSDPAPVGFSHVRVNWMIKKPPTGGNPVLGGVEYSVEEGDLWVCFASEEIHASTPVHGGERLICSFGALINWQEAFALKATIK